MHGATDGEGGWRLPARELEDAVTRTISTFLRDEIRVVDGLALKASTDLLRKMLGRANALAVELGDDRSQDRRPTIQRLVGRITLQDEALRIDLSRAGLLDLIGVGAAKGDVTEESFTITTPLKLKRRGVEAKLIVGAPQEVGAAPNAKLVALLAQAQRWLDLLVSGEPETVDQIARREKLDASDVGRTMQLAFLAPDMVEAILTGRQPVELTAQRLKRLGVLPLDWDWQRRLLGFRA